MLRAPEARLATRLPRFPRAAAVALCVWALFAVACATATPPQPRSLAGALYGAPRAAESLDFAVAPPLAAAEAPEAAPILEAAPAEPSSLFIARAILAERAPQLDELQKEGVARALVKAEHDHGLPVLLVLALIEQES